MYARTIIFFLSYLNQTSINPLNILYGYALNNKSTYFSIFFNSWFHFRSILYSFLVILMKLPC